MKFIWNSCVTSVYVLFILWFDFVHDLISFFIFTYILLLDYYEHQYFTSVLFHMFSFIKNALFGSYSWMSHRTFIESSAVTTAFWLDQYGGRFASIFRRCPPSMFWGQWWTLTLCRENRSQFPRNWGKYSATNFVHTAIHPFILEMW